MPISRYENNPHYFTNKNKILAVEIDTQFNKIVDYLNSVALPTLNDLVSQQFRGVNNPTLNNSFLTNVGDGTLQWSFVTNDFFQIGGISLNKIERKAVNSIITTNAEGAFVSLEPTDNYQVLSTQITGSASPELIFTPILNSHFSNRCVQGRHIANGTLTADNIDVTSVNILSGELTNIKFADNSITTEKLLSDGANVGLTAERLTNPVRTVFPHMLLSRMIPIDFFAEDAAAIIFGGLNVYSPANAAQYERIFNLSTTVYGAEAFAAPTFSQITPYGIEMIKLASINGNRLHFFNTTLNVWTPSDADLIHDRSIGLRHLTSALREALT